MPPSEQPIITLRLDRIHPRDELAHPRFQGASADRRRDDGGVGQLADFNVEPVARERTRLFAVERQGERVGVDGGHPELDILRASDAR